MRLTYRVYFRDRAGTLAGREDFQAKDDRTALVIGALLCNACSDVCSNFELWQETRRIDDLVDDRSTLDALALSAETQASVAHHEEQLRDSTWAVAKSTRLLEYTRSPGARPRRGPPRR
ncbi:MAG TPA: hypothetical protein VN668_14660 [Stellaceae bacterium]|nr:hypothetical protein [Stellaceae bacterium]